MSMLSSITKYLPDELRRAIGIGEKQWDGHGNGSILETRVERKTFTLYETEVEYQNGDKDLFISYGRKARSEETVTYGVGLKTINIPPGDPWITYEPRKLNYSTLAREPASTPIGEETWEMRYTVAGGEVQDDTVSLNRIDQEHFEATTDADRGLIAWNDDDMHPDKRPRDDDQVEKVVQLRCSENCDHGHEVELAGPKAAVDELTMKIRQDTGECPACGGEIGMSIRNGSTDGVTD